jgi:hypothetical protein
MNSERYESYYIFGCRAPHSHQDHSPGLELVWELDNSPDYDGDDFERNHTGTAGCGCFDQMLRLNEPLMHIFAVQTGAIDVQCK